MSREEDLKLRLQHALLMKGQLHLAETLDLSSSEASRKISGHGGLTLDQLAKVMASVGANIVLGDEVVIKKEKYEALMTLSREALDHE